MDRSPRTISLAVALSLAVVGCTSSPWSAFRAAQGPGDPSAAEAADEREKSDKSDAEDKAGAKSDDATADADAAVPEARELNALMAELQQLGALDPDAQQQLMEDLRQTDPAMWKPIMARFRAALAYRRRTERRQQEFADDESSTGGGRSLSNREAELGDWLPDPAPTRDAAGPDGTGKNSQRSMLAGRSPLPQPAGKPDGSDVAANATRKEDSHSANDRSNAVAEHRDDRVRPASYDQQAEADWKARLDSTIRTLETDLRSGPDPESEAQIAQHAYLRLLYLVAGRRDDALRPIPAASSSAQDFWANEIYGLEGWLNAERTADPRLRAGEARKSLDDALVKLGEMAPLAVQGLAFCTAIQSYGCYTEFEKNEFVPGQEVLLYAEVENFKSERMPKGFHTALRSSYKIFDSRGQQVAEHEFPVTEEFCQSKRRDFFIGYHLRLPDRIYAGPHTLRLTIEDLKKNQIGQATIELTVRTAEQ